VPTLLVSMPGISTSPRLMLTRNTALAAQCGSYYFFGGIAMVLAGIAEFILGNSGCHLDYGSNAPS